MFRGLWDVLNKYKAELVVIDFVVDGGSLPQKQTKHTTHKH